MCTAGRRACSTLAVPEVASMEAHDVSEIDPLVKAAQSPGAPLVSSVNKVLHALQERQYLRHMVIEPQFIGIHPQNRDGHGVAWHDCHSLMANIVDVGFRCLDHKLHLCGDSSR